MNTKILKCVYTDNSRVVIQTRSKIAKVGSRHTIYLEKAFVEDSSFPFKPDEYLSIKIDKNRMIIEKENS
jgi:hypothetical protein